LTVSANTIDVTSLRLPATGTELSDERTVVFQPTCPLREDRSDVGLQPGGIAYTIRLPGHDGGAANTLRSTSGGELETTQVRDFTTADAAEPFIDFEQGPPRPVVRAQGSQDRDATHLELGGDPDPRVLPARAVQQLVLSVPGFEAPLNLHGDASTAVSVVIAFDQPVRPTSDNVSPDRLRLEFLDTASTWRPLETRVTLLANCSGTGAEVRLDPLGILPQATLIRAVVLPGFQDLVGEVGLVPIVDFAVAPTTAIAFTSLTPADRGSDEVLEEFDLGGDGPQSLEDTTTVFDVPRAEWNDGRLSAAFAFDGTGGPHGDFDWVHSGELPFDTTKRRSLAVPVERDHDLVSAAASVDLSDFTIEEGGAVRCRGPNPMDRGHGRCTSVAVDLLASTATSRRRHALARAAQRRAEAQITTLPPRHAAAAGKGCPAASTRRPGRMSFSPTPARTRAAGRRRRRRRAADRERSDADAQPRRRARRRR
jgi:hypothetical protein